MVQKSSPFYQMLTAGGVIVRRRFHRIMLISFSALTVLCLIACHSMSIPMTQTVIAAPTLFVVFSLPAILWHDVHRADRRDAAMVFPWEGLLIVLTAVAAVLSCRFAIRFPLCDIALRRIDQAMGLSTPAVAHWIAMRPAIGFASNVIYASLDVFIAAALLVPLFGDRLCAERFVLANMICLAVALPLSIVFPAIGPWVGGAFTANPDQAGVEQLIHSIRMGVFHEGASICFPSFHTIWAVLSASALWSFRRLRVLIAAEATLIIVSTIATGWHYFADVFAALTLSLSSLALADWILRCQLLMGNLETVARTSEERK